MSESRTIEASGPDIEAAITKGVSDLGVSRADVIVEILEEPARGLLGLGAKPAKVRLTLIRAPKTVEPISVPASSATGQSEQSIERAPSAGAKPPARASHDDIDDAWEEDGILSDSELAEDARVGAETLRELLGFLQMDARVIASRAESEDDEAQHWTLEIQGRDLGALIGRRGETLAALQYITWRSRPSSAGAPFLWSRCHPTNAESSIWPCATTRMSPQKALAKEIAARLLLFHAAINRDGQPPISFLTLEKR